MERGRGPGPQGTCSRELLGLQKLGSGCGRPKNGRPESEDLLRRLSRVSRCENFRAESVLRVTSRSVCAARSSPKSEPRATNFGAKFRTALSAVVGPLPSGPWPSAFRNSRGKTPGASQKGKRREHLCRRSTIGDGAPAVVPLGFSTVQWPRRPRGVAALPCLPIRSRVRPGRSEDHRRGDPRPAPGVPQSAQSLPSLGESPTAGAWAKGAGSNRRRRSFDSAKAPWRLSWRQGGRRGRERGLAARVLAWSWARAAVDVTKTRSRLGSVEISPDVSNIPCPAEIVKKSAHGSP